MVMQSKVESYQTQVGSAKTLPFQLVLLIGKSKNKVPITNLTNNPQEILQNMYRVKELVDLKMQLKTKENEPIYINWGNVADREDNTNISFVLEYHDQIYSLFSNEKTKEYYPWRCGMYHFEVKYRNQVYYGGFEVKPKNVDEQQLDKIHEYINYHLEGLAIDYVNYKKTFADLSSLENSSHWQFIKWYKTIEQKLHQSLNMIEYNSQKEMRKIYLVENEPKHLDSRSIRWENSAKGQAFKGNSYLNRKLILDSDSDSNRLVKFRLALLVTEIDKTLEMINNVRYELEKQLYDVTKDVMSLRDRVDKIKLSNRVTTRDKIRMKNTLTSKKIEQREIENNVKQITNILESLARSKNLLNNRLSSTFWSRIDDRPPKKPKLEKYIGYQEFGEIWNQYNSHSIYGSSQKTLKLPVYRSTSELYEYYVLLSVLNIMEELNFKTYKDSVREQLMTTFFESGFMDNTVVSYQKEHIRINVIYEELIEYNDDAALENKTHFFSLEHHRKPDIRVDLYINRDNEWKYNSSIVIEVKYSPLYNIYNEYGNTNAMDQMRDYWRIMYVDAEEKNKLYKRHPVSQVVCVYPGDKYAPIRENTAPGIFLQYYPDQESNNIHDIVGKRELKQIINSWIEKNS